MMAFGYRFKLECQKNGRRSSPQNLRFTIRSGPEVGSKMNAELPIDLPKLRSRKSAA